MVSLSNETHGQEIGQLWTRSSQKQRVKLAPYFRKALPHIFPARFKRKKEIVWFNLQAKLLQRLVLWAVNLQLKIKGPRERSTYILYVHACKLNTPTFGRLKIRSTKYKYEIQNTKFLFYIPSQIKYDHVVPFWDIRYDDYTITNTQNIIFYGICREWVLTSLIARASRLSIVSNWFDHGEFSGYSSSVSFHWKFV